MKPKSVEYYYPTKVAREAADAAVDALPGSTSIDDAITTWLRAYTDNKGAVRPREKGEPR